MAQLIYGLIPGVQIYFHTAYLLGNFAEAINALSDAGCDVIVDDIHKSYFILYYFIALFCFLSLY
jgi:hypothetical protein